MEFPDAVLAVLRDEGRPLHWTVIQDLALKRGYIDPFTQPDVRKRLLQALASLVKGELVDQIDKGVYATRSR
jgi:hypothetical protein